MRIELRVGEWDAGLPLLKAVEGGGRGWEKARLWKRRDEVDDLITRPQEPIRRMLSYTKWKRADAITLGSSSLPPAQTFVILSLDHGDTLHLLQTKKTK